MTHSLYKGKPLKSLSRDELMKLIESTSAQITSLEKQLSIYEERESCMADNYSEMSDWDLRVIVTQNFEMIRILSSWRVDQMVSRIANSKFVILSNGYKKP